MVYIYIYIYIYIYNMAISTLVLSEGCINICSLSCPTLCAIWYHLCDLKNVKNTHEGMVLLVKLQTEACNFTKNSTSPWVFFTFFKLYEWYQMVPKHHYIKNL